MKQGTPLPQHPWNRYQRVIVFDGVCNFCNAFVNFVLERDTRGIFKFGTLQSPPAHLILNQCGLSTEDYETFLLLDNGKIFTKSTAGLKILRALPGCWPWLYAFIIVPRPIRDLIYSFVARHRYRWMGKADTCRVPSLAERARFIEHSPTDG
ncbi:MAG: thiol-disulfide oxidoreductase DCC family protein [Nitrospirales bacterium]|nr:thiol-disulfide oxidoreductase DCC family protein [Nitrospirales bacterium]